MAELERGFQSLPPEYQRIIRLAQDTRRIRIAPLQELVGGWSGAIVFLVSVAFPDSGLIEHFILKLDRKNSKTQADEISRHQHARSLTSPEFVRRHIPEIALGRVESEEAIAIFYTIAGHSLRDYRPLSHFNRQSQLEIIFEATYNYLLAEWNAGLVFEQASHPQTLLEKWLGFRLAPNGNIERFLTEVCRVPPDNAGFLIHGKVLRNPLLFARHRELWESVRPTDAIFGMQHGDLNVNNILVNFSQSGEGMAGYYLIDFALFKERMPLLYDQRYLEMSYLIHAMSQTVFSDGVSLLLRLAEIDVLEPHQAPIAMTGAAAVIRAGRLAFNAWVRDKHPSLYDDLWGQYWLGGVAAGLSYCHKAGQPDEYRLAGFIYAAANLARYAERFPIPPPKDAMQLYEDGRFPRDASSETAVSHQRSIPHNLPAQPTPFIGRLTQVSVLKEMLPGQDTRLVTLTGPGGTGKTRLSLQVAHELLHHFPHGVFFVSLAEISSPELFIPKVAQSLGLREGGSLPLKEIVHGFLRNRRCLIVLDNFEHITTAASQVAELLTAAPGLKILVTSRILLNLRGEREFIVPPLEVPAADAVSGSAELLQVEAVQLFIERAESANPHFALSNDNATAVIEICRRLDGLPLALELAAARTRLLTAPAILARLQDRFSLLSGGARDLPSRQQALRSTIDWSYELLEAADRILFARLAVFVGGFTLDAATAVCDLGNELDVLVGVERLLNSSLLHKDEQDAEIRFTMLETIREYACERLTAAGEEELLQQQHAFYYGEIMRGLAENFTLFGPEAEYWLRWMDAEHDNLRAVMSWSQGAPDRFMPGVATVLALVWYWYRHGDMTEGREWNRWALTTPAGRQQSPVRGILLTSGATLAMHQNDFDVASNMVEEGLTIAYAQEEPRAIAMSLLIKGMNVLHYGDYETCRSMLEQSIVVSEESGFYWGLADGLLILATALLGQGDLDGSLELVRRAEQAAQQVGDDDWLTAYVLNCYGEVERLRGDYAAAEDYYRRGVALLHRQGDRGGDLPRMIHSLGYATQAMGDLQAAEGYFRESLAIFHKIGVRRGIAECLAGLAGLYGRRGQGRQGATLLAAAEMLLHTAGAVWWPSDQAEVNPSKEIIHSLLEDNEFEEAWRVGEALNLDQVLRFAADGS